MQPRHRLTTRRRTTFSNKQGPPSLSVSTRLRASLSAICQHQSLASQCLAPRRLGCPCRLSCGDVVWSMGWKSCVWGPHSLHTAEATEPCKAGAVLHLHHRRPNLPSSKLRNRDRWGVTDGHVSRQGPSLRLRSAGSASTRLLPGPVADAWSGPWLLAAPGALRRRRHPSGAALARPLRTWAVRFAPCHPRHSYCMARKGSRVESLSPPGLVHL
jgi:hypothetical protein